MSLILLIVYWWLPCCFAAGPQVQECQIVIVNNVDELLKIDYQIEKPAFQQNDNKTHIHSDPSNRRMVTDFVLAQSNTSLQYDCFPSVTNTLLISVKDSNDNLIVPLYNMRSAQSYAVNRLASGYFYVKKLPSGTISNIDQSKIQKLKKDKAELKLHLKITRHNNQVYRDKNEKLTKKINELEGNLLKTKTEIESGRVDLALMKKKIEKMSQLVSDLENCTCSDNDLVTVQQEIIKCNQDLDAVTKKSLQYYSENASNQKMIQQLKANQTRLAYDLENLDADLVISKKKTNECTKELEDEMKKNLQCQSENGSNLKTILKLKSNQTELISDLQSLKNMHDDLVSQMTKQNLLCESTYKTSTQTTIKNPAQTTTQTTQTTNVSDSWGAWSECSKTCGTGQRIRTRDCLSNSCSGEPSQTEECHKEYCVRWKAVSQRCDEGTQCRYLNTRKCIRVDDNGSNIGSGSGCIGSSFYYSKDIKCVTRWPKPGCSGGVGIYYYPP